MPNNWKTYKLEEVTERVTVGFVGSMAKEYVDKGVPMLRSQNIKPFKLDYANLKFISKEFHQRIIKSSLKVNDVAIIRTGNPGIAAVIEEGLGEINCSDLVLVTPDLDKINPYFLCYYFNSVARHYVSSQLVGAVQQHFNVGSAKKMEIRLPSINEQKVIVDVLKSINDKIELNLQQNKTLEEMAMALYKHWFVDFGPFKDGKFIESELGLIPQDWEVKKLDALAQFKNGKGLKKEFKIDDGKYNVFGSNGVIGRTNETTFDEPVVAIGRVGANYGEVHYSIIPCWISDNAVTVQPTNQECFWWLLQTLRRIDYSNFVAGSAQPLITQGAIKEVEVAVPNEASLMKYSRFSEELFNQIQHNQIENQTLTNLRDTLLPKLISGQIRVKEAQEQLKTIL